MGLFGGGMFIEGGRKVRVQLGARWDIMAGTSMMLKAATTASAVCLWGVRAELTMMYIQSFHNM